MRRLGSISCGLIADRDMVSPNRLNKSITSRSSSDGSTLIPGTRLAGKMISSSCSNRSTEELPMRFPFVNRRCKNQASGINLRDNLYVR